MSKLKILHLFNNYLPPTMNWAHNLMEHLPDTLCFVTARSFLKKNFYNSHFQYISNPFGDYHQHFNNLNNKHKFWYYGKILTKASEFLQLEYKYLIHQVKENKIDLLHAHFAYTGCYFSKIASETRVPLIVSFYGYDYERLPYTQPVYYKKYKHLFKEAAQFICEGPHGAKILTKMGCPSSKISIVPLGINTKDIQSYKRSKSPDQLSLIQIATFTEKKGHIYALKAFHKALKSGEHMHLTMIGKEKHHGGNIKNKVINYIKNNNLSDKVTISDSIDYNDLHHYLEGFQVFLHPSCYAEDKDCEGGAPIVLLDAQATGMPVISTTHCDIPSEVIHGQTGLLSKEKDIDDIANNILQFYKMDSTTYLKYCKSARAHVESEYNVIESAKKMKKNYLHLLNSIK